jgi:hypothetical protein
MYNHNKIELSHRKDHSIETYNFLLFLLMHLVNQSQFIRFDFRYKKETINLRIHDGLSLFVDSSKHLPYLRGIFCNADTVS